MKQIFSILHVQVAAMIVVVSLGSAVMTLPAEAAEISVYKTPNCGCCSKWVDHLEENGFVVNVHSLDELSAIKSRFGVPRGLQSCHTAEIDGYVVEGHVPADDIRRLLEEKPEATGIAVPGMPVGSPGMEYGDRKDVYDVMLFGKDGWEVYATHGE